MNAASPKLEELAPNTIATLYGKDLAYGTRAIAPEDLQGSNLPTALGGTGVRLLVANVAVPVLFVSPHQVNFVLPSTLPKGLVDVQLGLNGRFGPTVKIKIADVSPALFAVDPEFAVAARADGTLVSRDAPARGGEVVVLYATGLGATEPRIPPGQIVTRAGVLVRMAEFRVWLDGLELPADAVFYAGTTPGFAGLYQINLVLPEVVGRNPEVRIGFGTPMSPAGLRLPAE